MTLSINKQVTLAIGSRSSSVSQFVRSLRPARIANFAIHCLMSNLRRTILALVGIGIGLASIVAISLVSRSAEQMVLDSFAGVPLTMISLEMRSDSASASKVLSDPNDVDAKKRGWKAPLGLMQALAKEKNLGSDAVQTLDVASCQIKLASGDSGSEIVGVEDRLLANLGIGLVSGRNLHHLDASLPWVLVGNVIARRWYADGHMPSVGQPFLLCGNTVYLAGVLSPAGQAADLLGVALDDSVIMRKAGWQRMGQTQGKMVSLLKLSSEDSLQNTVQQLKQSLQQISEPNQSTVRSAAAMAEIKRKQVLQNAQLAMLLSGISLLVGGFGIMNVMLVAGLERRYDIAVCMALGADRLTIGMQFLIESAMLGVIGGALGVVFGFLLGWGALSMLSMPWKMDYQSIFFSLALGAVIGSLSGLYPAVRVSRLDCAEVLAS